MKLKLTITFLIITIYFNQYALAQRKIEREKLTSKEGLIYFKEKLFTGIMIEKNTDNGKLLYQASYKEGIKYGISQI